MRELTSMDEMFLAAEDGRTVTNVSALAIVDPNRPDQERLSREDLVDIVRDRIHLLPPLRWRLKRAPFDLARAVWVDSDVDLDYHIREIGLPPPGSRDQLLRQVSRIASRPMDRDRPLWEIYLIDGLDDDLAAVLTKFHHAAVDGVTGAEIMSILFDAQPSGRVIEPAGRFVADDDPSIASMMGRAVVDSATRPFKAGRTAARLAINFDQVPTFRPLPGASAISKVTHGFRSVMATVSGQQELGSAQFLNDAPPTAPHTKTTGVVSRRRSLALADLSLDDVRAVKDHFGATVNDVVVAVSAGALRVWLQADGELPADPLVAVIPVSLHGTADDGAFGNEVGAMVAALPTDEPDPFARLSRCRDELRTAKEEYKAVPATLLRDSTDMVPPVLLTRTVRALTRLGTFSALDPIANVIISNVPGSRSRLYCAGAPILEHYPVSTVADSLGLNITVLSYVDRLGVGIVADRDLAPHLDELAAAMVAELDTFLSLIPKDKKRRTAKTRAGRS